MSSRTLFIATLLLTAVSRGLAAEGKHLPGPGRRLSPCMRRRSWSLRCARSYGLRQTRPELVNPVVRRQFLDEGSGCYRHDAQHTRQPAPVESARCR